MDGLEPPLLDETWGLGVRKHLKDIVANATLTDAIPLEEEEAGTARGKRSTENLGDDHVVVVENSLDENDMDGLEPPLLDETWGLGVRKHLKDIVANATLTDAIPLEEEEEAGTARGKRS